MAARLYTKEEFELELRDRLGLAPTDQVTATNRAWKTKMGRYVAVPLSGNHYPEIGERYPDSWMARIYLEVQRVDSI